MAVSWIAEAAGSAVAGADPVVNVPTGTANNDLMLAVGLTTSTQTITAPAGWNTHPDSNSTSRPLFWRIASSEPANYTWVTSGAATGVVTISTYRGIDTSNPFAGTAGFVATNSTTVTIGAATPSVACFLAHLVQKLNLNTWTPPASASPDRWDHTISTVASTAGAHELVASGSTGTRAWTASTGAAAGMGYIVPLREATQQVAVTGFAPAVVFGTPTLIQDQFVTPSGFTPSVAFGTPTLRQTVTPTGFAPSVVFGTPTVILDQFLPVTGFAPDVDFGTPGIRQNVTPAGFTPAVQFGTPTLVPDQLLTPAGFEVPVLFGEPSLTPVLTVSGFELDVLFGDPTVILDNVLPVTGFQIPVQFGTPSITSQPVIEATVFNHETGDPAPAGATVQLFTEAGVLVDETTTDADGHYIFHLPFGTTGGFYTVVRFDLSGVDYQGVSSICEPV